MRAPSTSTTIALCAAVALAAFTLPAVGQQAPVTPPPQSPEVIQKVYACAAVTDNAARLACFDAAVGALKTAETTGQFAAVDAASVRQIEREAFGFSLPSIPRLILPSFGRQPGPNGAPAAAIVETAELNMTIARRGSFDGRPSYVMNNGQVWVLVDTDDNRLARPGATVTIKRAAVGSFLMKVDAGGAAVRVRRAQ